VILHHHRKAGRSREVPFSINGDESVDGSEHRVIGSSPHTRNAADHADESEDFDKMKAFVDAKLDRLTDRQQQVALAYHSEERPTFAEIAESAEPTSRFGSSSRR
jgi:hypothetical protein